MKCRSGLSNKTCRRVTFNDSSEELGDHLEDLKEENVEADAISRLGEPDQVAESAVGAYRRRSFLGRHPTAAFMVFAISPVVPLYLVFLLVRWQ